MWGNGEGVDLYVGVSACGREVGNVCFVFVNLYAPSVLPLGDAVEFSRGT